MSRLAARGFRGELRVDANECDAVVRLTGRGCDPEAGGEREVPAVANEIHAVACVTRDGAVENPHRHALELIGGRIGVERHDHAGRVGHACREREGGACRQREHRESMHESRSALRFAPPFDHSLHHRIRCARDTERQRTALG